MKVIKYQEHFQRKQRSKSGPKKPRHPFREEHDNEISRQVYLGNIIALFLIYF